MTCSLSLHRYSSWTQVISFSLLTMRTDIQHRNDSALCMWWVVLLLLERSLLTVMAATMFGYGKTQFGVAVQNLSSILKVSKLLKEIQLFMLNQIQIFWVVRVAYCLVNTFTKLSILTLYLRVFQSNRFKWHVLIVMALTAAYGITFTFIPLFQCRPISYYWLQWDYELRGTCIPGNIYIWTSAAFNISLDIIVILLPIRQVMLLNLKLGKKLQIVGMFCVGFL